jgi:LCP family protein required for cell wall assembly
MARQSRSAIESRRPRPRRRLARAIGIALVLTVMLGGVGTAYLLNRYESMFGRESLLSPGSRSGHPAVDGPLNLLLLGSDLRARNPQAGQRSDTIIIAHVSRSLDHVYLISVPRDLLVRIPADPAQNFQGDTTKINAAFEYGHGGHGGAQLVSATLNELMGVVFDGAASVDFDGLKGAVDVLGGVRMCVDQRTVSIHSHAVFESGCRLMASTEVLDYLRQRNYDDGDYTRQKHQQQFLKAVVDRASSTGVVTNPVRLDQFLRAVAPALTIDSGGVALEDLVFNLRGVRPGELTGVTIPSEPAMIEGTSFVVATGEAAGLFAALRDDDLQRWTRENAAWVNAL